MNGTCDKIERVSAYHDGELPEAAAAAVEAHVAECGECAGELARYRAMSRQFASAELPRMPGSVRRRIRRSIEDERASRRLRIVRALTGVAAAIFLVAASRVIYHQNMGGTPSPGGGPGGMTEVADWEAAAVGRDSGAATQATDPAVILPASTAPSNISRSIQDDLEKGND